jgi:hypothetical protein
MSRFSHTKARITFSVLLAPAFLVAMATPAAALSPWWTPVYLSCPSSQVAQLTVTVAGGNVYIGHSATSSGAGSGAYWNVSPGVATLIHGTSSFWWQKWASPGDITKWSSKCVNYQMALAPSDETTSAE